MFLGGGSTKEVSLDLRSYFHQFLGIKYAFFAGELSSYLGMPSAGRQTTTFESDRRVGSSPRPLSSLLTSFHFRNTIDYISLPSVGLFYCILSIKIFHSPSEMDEAFCYRSDRGAKRPKTQRDLFVDWGFNHSDCYCFVWLGV